MVRSRRAAVAWSQTPPTGGAAQVKGRWPTRERGSFTMCRLSQNSAIFALTLVRLALSLITLGALGACQPPQHNTQELSSATKSSEESTPPAADEEARKELMATLWVKDAYVSPAHMNVGVLRGEKDWSTPMIGNWVCSVLRKHGSRLTWVRFVDIQEVVYEGKSPRQAEISKLRCPEASP